MLLNQTKKSEGYKNFIKKGLNDRAFRVYFRGEGSIDDGGPLRETFDFVCVELQTSSLPVLIPTANKASSHGEMQHLYYLNHNCGKGTYANEEMEMLYFFGILIGYGILSTNPLPLYIHPIFWKQVVGF